MIEEAAKSSNAHNFIMSFPDGYDTHVGTHGMQLSGGKSVLSILCFRSWQLSDN